MHRRDARRPGHRLVRRPLRVADLRRTFIGIRSPGASNDPAYMGRNSLDGPRLALLVVTLVVRVEVQKFTTSDRSVGPIEFGGGENSPDQIIASSRAGRLMPVLEGLLVWTGLASLGHSELDVEQVLSGRGW